MRSPRVTIPAALSAAITIITTAGCLLACTQEVGSHLGHVELGLGSVAPLPEDPMLISDSLDNARLDAFFPSYHRCRIAKDCGSLVTEMGQARLRGHIEVVTHPHPGRATAASWRDYDLTVRFRSDLQHPEAADGFGFRRQRLSIADVHTTYGYLLRHQSGTWTLLEHGVGLGPNGAELAQVDYPAKQTKGELIAFEEWMKKWHSVRIRVTTPAVGVARIQVFVDGMQILDVHDESAQAQGAVELHHEGTPGSELLVSRVGVEAHADSRSTWTQTGSIDGGWLKALAVHPNDPDIAYVGAWDGGLYKTVNGGQTWREFGLPHGLPKVRIRTIVLAPSDPDVVYVGTAMKHVNSLWRSDDGGNTWRWTTAGDVRIRKTMHGKAPYLDGNTAAIAVDPADPMHVFIGIDQDGVYESHDGGETFELEPDCDPATLSPATHPDCDFAPPHRFGAAGKKKTGGVGAVGAIAVDPEDPAFVVAGTSSGSKSTIVRSDDGGDTWTTWNAKDAGGKDVHGAVTQLVFAASEAEGRRLFAVIDGKVFRSQEGPGGWGAWAPVLTACSPKPGKVGAPAEPLSKVATLVPVGHTGRLLVFRGLSTCLPATVAVSHDLGGAWRRVVQPGFGIVDFLPTAAGVAAGEAGDRVYALSWGHAVQVSTELDMGDADKDGAVSFEERSQGVNGHRILALATVPGSPERVFAGDKLGLWTSSDHGDTWVQARAWDAYLKTVLAIAVHPETPDTIWVGGGEGWAPNATPILRSTQGGAPGTFVDPRPPEEQQKPFPMQSVVSLAIDPHNPSVVYAGTGLGHYKGWQGQGLWRSLNGGESWQRLGNPDNAICDPIGDVTVPAIVIDPTSLDLELGRSTRIAIATNNAQGVYVSHDGGDCFEARPNGTEQGCATPVSTATKDPMTGKAVMACPGSMIWSLVADPADPSTLYSATNTLFGFTNDHDPKGTGHNAIYKSPDFGDTWTLFSIPGLSVDAMAIDPRNSHDVYLGLHDSGIVRVDADGVQKDYVNSGLVPLLAHIYPMRMAVSQTRGGDVVLYSGSCGRGVFRNHLYSPELATP